MNIYGDEDVTVNNDFTKSSLRPAGLSGLGFSPDRGEIDLVDYGTDNLKLGGALHYRTLDSLEFIVASNYSTGTTVYQGDNRYRLDAWSSSSTGWNCARRTTGSCVAT